MRHKSTTGVAYIPTCVHSIEETIRFRCYCLVMAMAGGCVLSLICHCKTSIFFELIHSPYLNNKSKANISSLVLVSHLNFPTLALNFVGLSYKRSPFWAFLSHFSDWFIHACFVCTNIDNNSECWWQNKPEPRANGNSMRSHIQTSSRCSTQKARIIHW